MQWRFTKSVFGVDVRACTNQQLQDTGSLWLQGRVQSRLLAMNGERVHVGTSGEQRLDRFCFTVERRDLESRQTPKLPVRIRADFEEVFDAVRLAFGNGFAELFVQVFLGLF